MTARALKQAQGVAPCRKDPVACRETRANLPPPPTYVVHTLHLPPPPVVLQGAATPPSRPSPQFRLRRKSVAATPPPKGRVAPHRGPPAALTSVLGHPRGAPRAVWASETPSCPRAATLASVAPHFNTKPPTAYQRRRSRGARFCHVWRLLWGDMLSCFSLALLVTASPLLSLMATKFASSKCNILLKNLSIQELSLVIFRGNWCLLMHELTIEVLGTSFATCIGHPWGWCLVHVLFLSPLWPLAPCLQGVDPGCGYFGISQRFHPLAVKPGK